MTANLSIGSLPPKEICAFDFDGTLTLGDSFARVVSWKLPLLRLAYYWAVTSPLLLCYALGLTGNATHKMALFARRFRGWPQSDFEQHAQNFAFHILPHLLRPHAVEKLRWHRQKGHTVVIITASFPEWIKPWAQSEGVAHVLGSELEVIDRCLTGRMAGPNCYGMEKVLRLRSVYPDYENYRLVAYGDSSGDRELLAAADEAHYRCFD
jgi:phosphatidylglycerophosphatase C